MQNRNVTAGSIWAHYKGQHFAVVLTVAQHTEVESQKLVIYRCYDLKSLSYCGTFARPMDVFLSTVSSPGAEDCYRFTEQYSVDTSEVRS